MRQRVLITNLALLGASNGRRETRGHIPAFQGRRCFRESLPAGACAAGGRETKGKTKIVATRVLGSPQGISPFYRIAEIHFPSMQALEACAASEGGKEALAHAVKISSGGPPIFLVAEEETVTFTQTAVG